MATAGGYHRSRRRSAASAAASPAGTLSAARRYDGSMIEPRLRGAPAPSHPNLRALIAERVAERGEAPFLVRPETGETFSYAEMGRRVGSVARVLAERGVGHGTRVSILCFNGPDFVWPYLAIWSLGADRLPDQHGAQGRGDPVRPRARRGAPPPRRPAPPPRDRADPRLGPGAAPRPRRRRRGGSGGLARRSERRASGLGGGPGPARVGGSAGPAGRTAGRHRARRPGPDHLHLGHDREAEGRRADPAQLPARRRVHRRLARPDRDATGRCASCPCSTSTARSSRRSRRCGRAARSSCPSGSRPAGTGSGSRPTA